MKLHDLFKRKPEQEEGTTKYYSVLYKGMRYSVDISINGNLLYFKDFEVDGDLMYPNSPQYDSLVDVIMKSYLKTISNNVTLMINTDFENKKYIGNM